MLASNQPYNRVDDGVGAGLVSGAVIGGAMAGGVHTDFARKSLKTGASAMKDSYKNKYANLQAEAGMLPTDKQEKRLNKLDKRVTQSAKLKGGIDKYHGKAFGSGAKGKAIAYGGSVLAGSLLGMGADAMND